MSDIIPTIAVGPFAFHLTSATVMRLVPMLPDSPTFHDVKAAIVAINAEDAAKAIEQGRPSPYLERVRVSKLLTAMKRDDPVGYAMICERFLVKP